MFRRRHLRALGKQLTVITMSYGGSRPQDCAAIARPVFRALAPYVADPVQLLFVRDNPSGITDGEYINGSTSFRSEVLVSVPSWPASRVELTSTIAHELHHLARWQNAGYGTTLGGALLSEGFATWFEVLMSGWNPPWIEQRVPEEALSAAVASWDKPYNSTEWFSRGSSGKQIGYALGYALVTRATLGSFDLQSSLVEGPTSVFLHTLQTMREDA